MVVAEIVVITRLKASTFAFSSLLHLFRSHHMVMKPFRKVTCVNIVDANKNIARSDKLKKIGLTDPRSIAQCC